jgi:hypothetical protein
VGPGRISARSVGSVPVALSGQPDGDQSNARRRRLDSRCRGHIFASMSSVMRELQHRVRADQSVPRFDP